MPNTIRETPSTTMPTVTSPPSTSAIQAPGHHGGGQAGELGEAVDEPASHRREVGVPDGAEEAVAHAVAGEREARQEAPEADAEERPPVGAEPVLGLGERECRCEVSRCTKASG